MISQSPSRPRLAMVLLHDRVWLSASDPGRRTTGRNPVQPARTAISKTIRARGKRHERFQTAAVSDRWKSRGYGVVAQPSHLVNTPIFSGSSTDFPARSSSGEQTEETVVRSLRDRTAGASGVPE